MSASLSQRRSFGQWVDRWWATTVNLRPNTRVAYERTLRLHLRPALERYPLASIDVLAVRTWLAKLEADGVGPSVRAKSYRLLNRIMSAAVEARYIPSNPCVVKGASTEPVPALRIATPAQVTALSEAVPACFKALVLVAAYGGLRWAELLGLRRRHVDLARGTVTVVEQLVEVSGQFLFGPPKSRAGQRTVTLPTVAVKALTDHLARWTADGPDALVFRGQRGGTPRRGRFHATVWRPATIEAGVPGLRFHDLRHTAGTLATAAGATLREVMDRLGHSSAAAAIRYQHARAERDAALARSLDELLADEASGTDVARDGHTDDDGPPDEDSSAA
jgi:integrase